MKTDTRGGHATTEADPWFLQAKGHPGSAATPRNKEETRKAVSGGRFSGEDQGSNFGRVEF